MFHGTIRYALAVVVSAGAVLALGAVSASAQTPSGNCTLTVSGGGGAGNCSADVGVANVQSAGGAVSVPAAANLPASGSCTVGADGSPSATANCSADVAGTHAQVSATVPAQDASTGTQTVGDALNQVAGALSNL